MNHLDWQARLAAEQRLTVQRQATGQASAGQQQLNRAALRKSHSSMAAVPVSRQRRHSHLRQQQQPRRCQAGTEQVLFFESSMLVLLPTASCA